MVDAEGSVVAVARDRRQQQLVAPAFARLAAMLSPKGAICLLYAVNLLLSYLLMLAVMTYNAGVLVAVVVGLASGHYLHYPSPGKGQYKQSDAGNGLAAPMSDLCCPQRDAA